MTQKFIFSVEVFPIVKRRLLGVEQLVPNYDHGYKEEFVVSSRDFEEAAALLKLHFGRYMNKYCVRSMVSEVIK